MSRFGGFAIASVMLAAAAAIVGCGGGGGGGGTTTGGPPTQPPTIPPSPFVCPSGGCTSFTLSGTSTQTVTRAYPTPTPKAQVVVSTVGQSINVVSGAMFHGNPATDYQTVETDTAPTQTLTTNTDNYVQIPVTTGNIVDIGYHSTDSNGVVMDVQYPDGNIIGQVPLGAGWVNDASSIISETDPDGTSIAETVNPDGSYSLTTTAVVGTTTATQNSDGTGTATIPAVFVGGTATLLTIPAQSGGTINYTVSAVGAPAPTPAPIVIPVGAWYPPSPTLASDSTTNIGVTAIPKGCVAPAFGSSGTDLRRTQMRLDVIFGLLENETTDTWVTGVGPVCQRITDTLNVFYDFTGQSGAAVLGGPSSIQTDTLSELIGLTAASKSASALRGARSTSRAGEFQAQLVLGRARLEHWRLGVLKQQLANLRASIQRGIVR